MKKVGIAISVLLSVVMSAALAQTGRQTFLGVDPGKSNIPLDQILRGNPVPQGIPSIGHEGDWIGWTTPTPGARFVSQEEAAAWLSDREPVVAMSINGVSRAYPLQILTYHEIANDVIGEIPVAVTFCPLCNSAIAFDRRIPLTQEALDTVVAENPNASLVDLDEEFFDHYTFQHGVMPEFVKGVEVTFGTTGLLFNSNLIMFDSQTSTFWTQILGEGNVGALTDTVLLNYPAQIISFAEFRETFPEGSVLSRDTGFSRPYGNNPYVGYDDADSPPFLFPGMTDGRLPPKARVVSVDLRGETVAYPFEILVQDRVVNDQVGDEPVTVFWQVGTSSALNSDTIASGRDIGAVGVFSRSVADRVLTFEWREEGFVDNETGSRWNLSGRAVEGELSGAQLTPIVHDNTLWFAWAAFKPETRIFVGDN
ncbi:MAG: DUF3179 domain-containing protein [Trueperaceae bacterium]|nr:MAG: DUF3179 domain-containing protein [Trueperaceae bacterium]